MFFPQRTEALELEAEQLLALRFSLNAPVVAIPDLPVGPARAAILCHAECDGRRNVTVAVRSLKGGEAVLFSYDGDLEARGALELATDAALSFGESMGFLFDDDAVALAPGHVGARRRALGLWNELVRPGRYPGSPAAHAPTGTTLPGRTGPAQASDTASGPGSGRAELPSLDLGAPLLGADEAASTPLKAEDLIGREGDRRDPEGPPHRAAPPPSLPPLPLSKFRQPAPGLPAASRPPAPPSTGPTPAPPAAGPASAPPPAASVSAPGPTALPGEEAPAAAPRRRTALGRLKLVKRRKSASDAGRTDWLTKLLTSF